LLSETDGSVEFRFKYTGKFFDEVTDLQYNLNRWYDPNVGRWISEDPIGFAAGDSNLSRYVSNNSPNSIGPSGLASIFSDIGNAFAGAVSDTFGGAALPSGMEMNGNS